MLTPEYLEQLPDVIVELYREAEDAILTDMARRLTAADLWTASADWQYRKLREAGALSEDILAELSRRTGKTKAELRKLMQAAAIQSMGYDEGIYESHGMTGEPLASSDALTEILNAGYRATLQTMQNLTRTTANTATQQFERALDSAWMKVQSGAFSTDAAVKSAVNELAEKGVECIKYPSGHRDTLEVAVRRAVVTGVNQTCGQLQLERAREMGADLMELTAHEGARPSHAEWQGQIVSLSGQPGYLSLEDIGYGDVTGFKGANCRHDWNPWFEGMPRTWTPEALAKLNEPKYEWDGKKLTQYEASQIQRYNERQIRKWKRIYAAQKAAGQDTSEAAAKISYWNKRQGDFLRQTGFKRRQSREELAGFGMKETREASEEYAAELKAQESASIRGARASDVFAVGIPQKGDAIKPQSLYKEMQKSEVGKHAYDYILQKGLNVEVNYTQDVPANLRGQRVGNNLYIFAHNTKSVRRTVQTIIHETAHHELSTKKATQWEEAYCFAQEEKHLKNALTYNDLRSIIRTVKRLYSDLSWR